MVDAASESRGLWQATRDDGRHDEKRPWNDKEDDMHHSIDSGKQVPKFRPQDLTVE
jgi:hypothetical protein